MPLTASRALVRQNERWFVRRGVPSLIVGYGFTRHVLPRMLPFLAVVAVAGLAWPLRAEPWAVAGVLAAAAVAGAVLARFGRRLVPASRAGAVAVLGGYAAVPAAVALTLLAVGRAGEAFVAAITLSVAFAAAFAASWLATTYGAVPLTRRALGQALRDLGNSLQLQGRALPLLLFVTLFFFFTGELWQAMNRLSWWRVIGVIALFAAVTVLAAAGRLRDEIGRVEQDLSVPRLDAACRETPLAGVPIADLAAGGPLEATPLGNREAGNLLLMLATRQLVQAFVVGLGLFVFLLAIGLLLVQGETAEQWIGGPARYSALLPGVPVALLRNAALLAGFGSMYFAVTSMSDAEHRHRFFAPILDEVERVLAVRAVYLAVHDVVYPSRGGTSAAMRSR
ncbi:MAG TPA: hypothetical protein VHI50_01895 [Micromonosporaceae bacterium]|nr:hypothetical protein [Micromonosporaceae bacterium]